MRNVLFLLLLATSFHTVSCAQRMEDHYEKIEQLIPMRDGVQLFTAIYIPRDRTEQYPILMTRTPYSCSPYGADKYPYKLGPGGAFETERFIFVYQDVRGRYMSEGKFQEVTPAIAVKKSRSDVDESSDTYDTIEWLLKHIDGHNGSVGLYGISYPGFYATASLPGAHPAIKAVSPQAPVTDEFEGDDVNHRGAFFLMDNFSFLNSFDHPRERPWKQYPSISSELRVRDAYDFYLGVGPIRNLDSLYFKGRSTIWNEYLAHTTKDDYWKARDIRTHLKGIKPAVLVVGGWFDAEDLFGALKTYEAIEQGSPGNDSRLVMGPWTHGAWTRSEWRKFGDYAFGSNTSAWFQQLEFDFFNYYLKGKGQFKAAEATIFVTGSNEWRSYSRWPPVERVTQQWYFHADRSLSRQKPVGHGFAEYISDPANPVPYINKKSGHRVNEYMVADQSFAAERSDVVCFKSAVLDSNTTICGPITAHLFVGLSGTDADFVVKLVDVLPDGKQTQQLVRAEVIRGKFRNSYEAPEAFTPGKITPVQLVLNDVAHTFLAGHRLMVQVQSSWFPLVDRNPQQFMNIAEAGEKDFKKATIRIYTDKKYASHIEVSIN